MRFDIITIFPNIFDSYLKETFIKKAQDKKIINIKIHNLSDWAFDRHQTVDGRPFGGGLGMVIKLEPIYKAVSSLIKCKAKNEKLKINRKTKVILFTPRGEKFNQQMAYKLSKFDRLIMICGRYEGVDERVAEHIADVEISIGDYDLMGGELPAMIVMETITRLKPGVIGKPEFLKERVAKNKKFLEYPQYVRPEVFLPDKKSRGWKAPKVLLSGNHKDIEAWKAEHGKEIGN